MDVLSRCACGGAPALYAPDVKSETKYAASVVCHHCGVSMQMANHDSDPKRVVAAWNRAHPHRINTMTVNEKGLEAAREAIIGNPLSDDQLSRIIKAYLRAASKDAEPMAWIAEAGENKQPCLCWTEAVALSEADGDRSRITPLFTHPRINAMLAAAPTSPAPSPAGGDVLLADRLLGPVTEAALRLIAGAFRRDGEELGSERRPRFSIPTRPDHDDDCVVIDALKEAARALSSKQRSGE